MLARPNTPPTAFTASAAAAAAAAASSDAGAPLRLPVPGLFARGAAEETDGSSTTATRNGRAGAARTRGVQCVDTPDEATPRKAGTRRIRWRIPRAGPLQPDPRCPACPLEAFSASKRPPRPATCTPAAHGRRISASCGPAGRQLEPAVPAVARPEQPVEVP